MFIPTGIPPLQIDWDGDLTTPEYEEFDPEANIRKKLLNDALQGDGLLSIWDGLAHSIPLDHDAQSVHSLKQVINLWITVKGHSFAKGWTDKFETKYKWSTFGAKPSAPFAYCRVLQKCIMTIKLHIHWITITRLCAHK